MSLLLLFNQGAGGTAYAHTVSDVATGVDSVVASLLMNASVTEVAVGLDSVLANVATNISVSDIGTASDSVTSVQNMAHIVADVVTSADSSTSSISHPTLSILDQDLMDLATLKTNLQAIVATASGLPTSAVVFGFANAGIIKPRAFIRIHFIGDRQTNPEARWRATPGSPVGSEITESTLVQVFSNVRIEYFSPDPESAVYMVRQVVNRLQTGTMQSRLDTLGWAITNTPQVQSVPAIQETTYKDRAFADFTISVMSSYEDLNTYFEHVQGIGTISVPGQTDISTPYSN